MQRRNPRTPSGYFRLLDFLLRNERTPMARSGRTTYRPSEILDQLPRPPRCPRQPALFASTSGGAPARKNGTWSCLVSEVRFSAARSPPGTCRKASSCGLRPGSSRPGWRSPTGGPRGRRSGWSPTGCRARWRPPDSGSRCPPVCLTAHLLRQVKTTHRDVTSERSLDLS